MNPNTFFCPIQGCQHSITGNANPFITQSVLLRHLNSTNHKSTHHLVNHHDCSMAKIYSCCSKNCPSNPKTFFSSLCALHEHYLSSHPPPSPPPSTPTPPTPTTPPTTPHLISSQILHIHSSPHTANHWSHGLGFINSVYHHKPPNFRTTWQHLICSRNKSAFCNLQASIICAIVVATTSCPTVDDAAPFWWLLFHLDMLIFAPSTSQQRNNTSIHHSIRDRIDAAFSGDIAYLFQTAMQVQCLKQNSCQTYNSWNCSAQVAANNNDYRTAVSRACASQSFATIGPQNITYVNKLYTEPVSPGNYPNPSLLIPHQVYSLPGNICDTICNAAKNKGAGVNADSIDLFTALVKCPIQTIKPDLHFIFNLIYQNKLPNTIKRYFTNMYLFCLQPTTPLNYAHLEYQQPFAASLQVSLHGPYVTNSLHIYSHLTMQSASLTDHHSS
jgi:hypothetical protein